MSSFVVILDACVLIPAAPRDTLLRAAAAGLYRLQWTEDILHEVEANLSENRMTDPEQARRVVQAMRSYFPEASVQGYQSLIRGMSINQGDRHVLAAAIVAGAQTIVTSNLRHFPDDKLAEYGIEAQSPDQFLTYQFDLDPSLMTRIVLLQAEALTKPSMTSSEVLEGLALHVPTFVELVRKNLAESGDENPY